MDVSTFLDARDEDEDADWLNTDFSFSKLYCFASCPRKARLRYLERLKDDTKFLISGKAIHFGQQVDNLAKVEGRHLPATEILDAAAAKLEQEAAGQSFKVDKDLFISEHRIQLEMLEEKGLRGSVRPIAKTVEAPFTIELSVAGQPGARLKGFIDVKSQVNREVAEVIDYKSGARPVYQGDAARNLQFTLYDLAAEARQHRIISFVRGGRQKPTVHGTAPVELTPDRTAKLLTFVEDTILAWRAAMKTGDWPKCAPSSHYCSATACAYYGVCYPRERPLDAKVYVTQIQPVGTVEMPAWRK